MKAKNQPPANASALLTANLESLRKRILKGNPLTLEEVKILQSMEGKKAPEATSPHFAKNQSELADVLGVSRQLIAYHCKRQGNPGRREDGRYSVQAWRDHLITSGRLNISGSKRPPNGGTRPDFGEGVCFAVWEIGEHLPSIVAESLAAANIEATPAQIDVVSVGLFFLQAAVADIAARRFGFPSVFDEDGAADWPRAIREAATRSLSSEPRQPETTL